MKWEKKKKGYENESISFEKQKTISLEYLLLIA